MRSWIKKGNGAGSERGSALAIAMLVLVLLTLIGTYALRSTDIEIQIAGNERLYQQAFYGAEAGAEFTHRLIWDAHGADAVPTVGASVQTHASLYDEIMDYATGNNDRQTDSPTFNPDIHVDLTDTLAADIDLDSDTGYLPGSAIQFAAGYEGIGVGAATGGIGKYYVVQSRSNGPRDSAVLIETLYQYVNLPGGS
jgi:Tfp pilus assembly protein PilX